MALDPSSAGRHLDRDEVERIIVRLPMGWLVDDPDGRLRFRVLLDDEFVDDHGAVYLDASRSVILEATDPDGIIPDHRLRIDPPRKGGIR